VIQTRGQPHRPAAMKTPRVRARRACARARCRNAAHPRARAVHIERRAAKRRGGRAPMQRLEGPSAHRSLRLGPHERQLVAGLDLFTQRGGAVRRRDPASDSAWSREEGVRHSMLDELDQGAHLRPGFLRARPAGQQEACAHRAPHGLVGFGCAQSHGLGELRVGARLGGAWVAGDGQGYEDIQSL
jgi:hypothetical protein